MISPMRLLGFPYEHFASRSRKGMWNKRTLQSPHVAPINKVQMKPGFVMAALIGGAQTKGFRWNGRVIHKTLPNEFDRHDPSVLRGWDGEDFAIQRFRR